MTTSNGELQPDGEPEVERRSLDEIAWEAAWDDLSDYCKLEVDRRRLALIDGISFLEDLARTLGGPIEAEGGLRRACTNAARQLRIELPDDFREGIIDRNIATHGGLAPSVEVARERVRIMRSVFFALRAPRGYRYVPVRSLDHLRKVLSPPLTLRAIPQLTDEAPSSDQRLAVACGFVLGMLSIVCLGVALISLGILLFSMISAWPPANTLGRAGLSALAVGGVGAVGLAIFFEWVSQRLPVLRSVQRHDVGVLSALATIILASWSLADISRVTRE